MGVDRRVQRGLTHLAGLAQARAHVHPRVGGQRRTHEIQGGRAHQRVRPLGQLVGVDVPRGRGGHEERGRALLARGGLDAAHVAVPRAHLLGGGTHAAQRLGEVRVEDVGEEQIAVAALNVGGHAGHGLLERGLGSVRGQVARGAGHAGRPRAHVGARCGGADLGQGLGRGAREGRGLGSGCRSWLRSGVSGLVPRAHAGGRARSREQDSEGHVVEATLPRAGGNALVEGDVAQTGLGFLELAGRLLLAHLVSSSVRAAASSASMTVAILVEDRAGVTMRRATASYVGRKCSMSLSIHPGR